MNYVDIFLVLIAALAAIQGYYKGFITELFALLAFFIGLLAGFALSKPLALWIVGESEWLGLARIVVFMIIFLLIGFIINLIARIIKNIFQMAFLGGFDNILGSILGVIKWSLLISLVVWALDYGGFNLPYSSLNSSLIFPHIAELGPTVFYTLEGIFPFVEDFFDGNIPDQPKHFAQSGVLTILELWT